MSSVGTVPQCGNALTRRGTVPPQEKVGGCYGVFVIARVRLGFTYFGFT